MFLNDEQKTDFIKKAAFIADKSTCNYKIGCVGVTTINLCGKNTEQLRSIQKVASELKIKEDFVYLKTWNENLPGEIYCQTCDSKGKKICIRDQENLKGRDFQKVCSIHAEQNLIAKCARYGISTEGMILFLTNTPCYICAKSIIQAGIKEIYYISEHTDKTGYEILKASNINLIKFHWCS